MYGKAGHIWETLTLDLKSVLESKTYFINVDGLSPKIHIKRGVGLPQGCVFNLCADNIFGANNANKGTEKQQ